MDQIQPLDEHNSQIIIDEKPFIIHKIPRTKECYVLPEQEHRELQARYGLGYL
jgi:hypothetical protein